ncbi:hypothetical protein PGT21_020430 [Puccinia graminis f. sp. tritici]|uniref:Uncharacterized protein n=1 Tax=Puccinia graminis f. sp. tritici TaxID=56615 RepID=A0A5B0MRL0_PUCGR|nr:hypothetical protein PGTUg99_007946 [Puccinia graminis f. sp. tritici]KAA1084189.1 hypothetical protein PGT21_020430 [Puccinia graminis f. sp. tritici]
MILTVIPRPAEGHERGDYSYTQELREASRLFLGLENPFQDPLNDPDELWTEKRAKLSVQIERSKAQRPQVLWIFLDLWVRERYRELWTSQLKKTRRSISSHAKGFFNYIFCFSIVRGYQI